MKPLRARVTYAWGVWWWRLHREPGWVEFASPYSYPTAHMAADAARLELQRRAEPDPVRRALLRIGAVLAEAGSQTRNDFKLVN